MVGINAAGNRDGDAVALCRVGVGFYFCFLCFIFILVSRRGNWMRQSSWWFEGCILIRERVARGARVNIIILFINMSDPFLYLILFFYTRVESVGSCQQR